MVRLKDTVFIGIVITGLHVGMVLCDCSEPAPVINAYRYLDSNVTGSNVTYICYIRFPHKSGNLIRYCQENGSYSGLPAICALDCHEPRNVTGASKSYSTTTRNSIVNYSCWSNYTQEDPTEEYTGFCGSVSELWSKLPYRCSESLALDLLSQEASTHDGIDVRPIDHDTTSCTSTSHLSITYWKYRLSNEKYYELHRVNLIMASVANLQSIVVEILVTENKGNHICQTRTSNFTSGWMNFTCEEVNWISIHGRFLKITATFSKPTSLELCEVEMYGRIKTIDCERPIFKYGTSVEVTGSGFLDEAKYSCLPGFKMVAGLEISKCWNTNWWGESHIVCYDGYTADTYPSMLGATCYLLSQLPLHILTREAFEIHSVTVQGPMDWSDISVGVIRALHSGLKKCLPDGKDRYNSNIRTFYCTAQPIASIIKVVISTGSTISICNVTLWGRKPNPLYEVFECLQTPNGHDYKGFINITVGGKACIAWETMSTLHDITEFPDSEMNEISNYCRNPNGTKSAPWCYTSISPVEWEYCPVMPCERMCKTEEDGINYRGNKVTTISGKKCMYWDTFIGPERFIWEVRKGASMYCRNIGRSQNQPWCYTSSSTSDNYEHCFIPFCPYNSDLNMMNISLSHVLMYQETYSFDDCWQFEIDTSTIDLLSFNLTEEIEGLCSNRVCVTMTCNSLNNNNEWYFIYILCDEVLHTSPKAEISTDMSTTSATTLLQEPTTQAPQPSPYTQEQLTSSTQNLTSATTLFQEQTTQAPQPSPSTQEKLTSSTQNLTSATTLFQPPTTQTTQTSPYTQKQLTSSTQNLPPLTKTNYTPVMRNASKTLNIFCTCPCLQQLSNYTDKQLEDKIKEINNILKIDKTTLSKTKQRYISIVDDRPSVVYIGWGTVGLFIIPFLFILLLDFMTLCRHLLVIKDMI